MPFIRTATLLILTIILFVSCTTAPPIQQRVAVDPGLLGTDTLSLLNQLQNQRLRQQFIRAYMGEDTRSLNTTLGNIGADELLSDARGVAQRSAQGELIARGAAEQVRSSTRITEEQRHELDRQLSAILAQQEEIARRLSDLEN